MATTIVAGVMDGINNQINIAIGQNVAAVMQAIAPFFFACLSLYLVYRIFQYMYDPPDIPVLDMVKMAGSLAMVTAFAFSSGYYMQYIVPFVLGTGDDIAKAISGATTVADQIDKLIDSLTLFVNHTWTTIEFSLTDIGGFVQGVATILMVMAGAVPFIVISFAYLMIAKIMVSLLLSVGPIFICFAFFPSTRGNFKQWTAQCMNYIMLIILYSAAFTLEISIIYKYAVIGPAANLNFGLCLQLTVVMLVFVAVTKEIPALASQLAGGIGISGLVGSSTSGILGAAAGGAFGALGGRAALGALGRGRNAAVTWAGNKARQGLSASYNRVMGRGQIKP